MRPKQMAPLVCLHCRCAFKKNVAFYLSQNPEVLISLQERPTDQKSTCPQCKSALIYLGRYFKTPLKSDLRAWRKVELLWKNGWKADGYHPSPKNQEEARTYLQERAGAELRYNNRRKMDAVEKRWSLLRHRKNRRLNR